MCLREYIYASNDKNNINDDDNDDNNVYISDTNVYISVRVCVYTYNTLVECDCSDLEFIRAG